MMGRAVLVFGSVTGWRRSMRDLFRPFPVTVLLASNETEAAKSLGDSRLVLICALDEAPVRRSLEAWRPAAPVVWLEAAAPDSIAGDARFAILMHDGRASM